ncbi:MAG: hypothetical protein GIKADHBN_01292 [Phycisphaerales bacterium]|nr:hypothetical protein [Phycisphaerales bacterium]
MPLKPGSATAYWMSGCGSMVSMYPPLIWVIVAPPSVDLTTAPPPVTSTLGLVGSTHRRPQYQEFCVDPEVVTAV